MIIFNQSEQHNATIKCVHDIGSSIQSTLVRFNLMTDTVRHSPSAFLVLILVDRLHYLMSVLSTSIFD